MKQTSLFEEAVSENFDPLRDARQEGIVDKWQANKGRGTLQAVTGFGKTRTALKAAVRLINSPNAKSQRDVTVVVPTEQLYRDWKEHLKQFDFPSRVYIINTLVGRFSVTNPLKTSLLILDEFHRYHSDVHGTVFDIVDYNFIFGTTATIDDNDPKFVRMKKLAPIIDTVTLEEARKHNWVSRFQIYNLGIEMTPEEKETYSKLGSEYNKYFKTFDFDFGLAMDCLSNDLIRRDYAKHIGWDEGAVMTHAVQFSRVVQKRKQFLYEIPSKLNKAKEIITRFSDRIFITFSESTTFADNLTEALPDISVTYHSSLDTLITVKGTSEVVARSTKIKIKGKERTRYKDVNDGSIYTWKEVKEAYPQKHLVRKGKGKRRTEAIKLFKDTDSPYKVINTARGLDEGFNVPRINASIVTSGSSKTRQSIQRLGRMLRVIKDKIAFQVEIYIKDTQDEIWLRKRQQESINIQWIDTIDEIII